MKCFDLPEVDEVLDLPGAALDGLIQSGILPVVELGCRRLVEAEAVLAFVPETTRPATRARLDAIELRRGGHHGQG